MGSEIALIGCTSPLNDCCGSSAGCTSCSQTGCTGDCYLGCNGCANNCGQAWLSLDYLLWQVSGYGVPPLVTSSPPGTVRTDSGVLPAATILFGNDDLNNDLRSGGRIRLGYWTDACRDSGFEGSFVALGEETTNFFAASDGSTGSLNRPFFNTDPNVLGNDALVIGFDDENGNDAFTGNTRITASSNLYSAHAAYRRNVHQSACHRVDFTLGYRYFQLDEDLRFNDDITADGAASGTIVGTNYMVQDLFETSNQFHGAELGLVSMQNYGRWSSEFIMKLALGNNHRTVDINGSTTFQQGMNPAFTQAGGLLAQPTNSGSFSNNHFVVIPELNANLNYRVNDRLKLTAGYTVIYVSDVVRPGDQIDFNVNGSILSGMPIGPADPAFRFASDSLWVHGLNIGATFNY